MAKIKHIALSTQDVDKTAAFYINVFGMKEIARIDSPNARGYYLSDGDLNLAILNFKNDAVAGVERGKEWSGIHHIGFQVESLEAIAEKLAAVGSEPRHDVNEALGVGHGHDTATATSRSSTAGPTASWSTCRRPAGWGRRASTSSRRPASSAVTCWAAGNPCLPT